ncbi:MAG: glucosamine-6-phosphate deaminase [Bacteroidetes bacterium]|nr:glucosamine-6-phosphate deaminase [Bacteroidota bacterium]
MKISIHEAKTEVGKNAAWMGVRLINQEIRKKGHAYIIVATGSSQFEMLDEMVTASVDWSKVTAFHLDEYIGMPATHPASFRRYLKERFVSRINLKAFHYINGESDPALECVRLGQILADHPVDVAFIGVGENGHLAFNDPPADFETEVPYLVVELDEVCRGQQLGEGWFPTLDDVPNTAISMSVRQIMKSESIICTVTEKRKAAAVKSCVEGGITPEVPASVLSGHGKVWMYLDRDAASKLRRQ